MADRYEGQLFEKVHGALVGGAIGDAMAGVSEMMHYSTIERLFGEIDTLLPHSTDPTEARFTQGDPAGTYTDDTRLKHIVCEAVFRKGGRITSDDFGNAWSDILTGWFFTPVVNSYYKIIQEKVRPRDAGQGNMASNSTAMSIAPIGIINACRPRDAALDAYDVASVVHRGYARDGAAAMAAAVAAAFIPGIEVGGVVDQSVAHLDEGAELRDLILAAVALASRSEDFREFRRLFYETATFEWPQADITGPPSPEGFYDTADPREAVPTAIALFALAKGDPKQAIIYAANFGRDCDTIGSMVGGIAGAYKGSSAIPPEWIDTIESANDVNQTDLAQRMTDVLLDVKREMDEASGLIDSIL